MFLADKIALVTGASRGIGQGIALGLGQQGACVIGTATTQSGAESITAYLKEQGIAGTGIALNLLDRESISDAVAAVKAEFGAPQVLINNAAVTNDNLMLRMKNEEWLNVIDTNLNGLFYLTKACLRDMVKSRWGRIINISSVVATTGNAGQANYAAAKAGVIGFTKSLAQEIASRGVTVNVVAPGFIDTDMTRVLSEDIRNQLLSSIPANRVGKPADISGAVNFLTSPGADYITGQTLHVNGGMFMV